MNQHQRPVFLNLFQIRYPVTAVASILHRISGVIVFLFIPVLLWMFDQSLSSPAHFEFLKQDLDGWVIHFVFWGVIAGLLFHLVAGIRHLLMDMGIGESLQGGRAGAWATLVISAILIALTGLWIFA